ncbi:MAG: hypothetical protein BGO29_11810 [Bacteroidales bacterium 36-12]|nr:MAG: hypothetical protein BGO29_11810 [Bacteroidales bacterium 36-12]
MNKRNLISFLALLVVAAIVYFTISTFYETTQEGSYGVTILSPSKNFDGFKSYQSKGRHSNRGRSSLLSSSSPSIQSSNFSTNTSVGVSDNSPALGNSPLSSSYKPSSKQNNTNTSSNSVGNSGFYASSRSGNQSTAGSVASGSIPTSNISKPFGENNTRFAAPPYTGTTSLPDPGGDPDDECIDDVIFLPVPDGFWFLISLALMYTIFTFIKIKRKEIISVISKLKASSLFLPFFF